MKVPVFILLSILMVTANLPSPVAARSSPGNSSTARSYAPVLSDMNTLLRESICKGTSRLITEYTYLFESTRHRKNDKGIIEKETELYEVYVPPVRTGRLTAQIRILLSRNGIPVPPGDLEKARLRAGERLEKAEKEASSQAAESASFMQWCSGISPIGTYFTVIAPGQAREARLRFTPLSILRFSFFDSPRYEDIDGRKMIALNFKPREGVSYEVYERYLAKIVGTIWIDAEEKIVARIEGWPVTRDNSLQNTIRAHLAAGREPAILYEQIRLPDGIWLPKKIKVNTNSHGYIFGRYYYDLTFVFTEHKRFTTSVEDVTIRPATKQP